MYSQFGQSPYGGHVYHAPLPHEDQAHFHPGGLPDLDSIGLANQPGGLSPGEYGYFSGFDTLSTAGHSSSVTAENVLLIGWEGGLRVQRVSRKTIDIIGKIEGLRGGVVGAKILPWTCRSDPGLSGRPYVAVIVHGPLLSEEHSTSSNTSEAPSIEDQDSDPSARVNNAPAVQVGDIVKHYQTTVEIYSLANAKHVATIFRTPPIEVDYSGTMKLPGPVGDLKLDANGKYLTVSSGESGEVFVFSPFTKDQTIHELESIRCIGKFWTSVRQRDKRIIPTVPNGVSDQTYPADDSEPAKGAALLSLSHRWLAVVPPSADSLFSVKGKAMLANDAARPPGITTHVSPPKPVTNCILDTPESESFMDRMSREVTQRTLKGAQWLGEHGMQAWNTYWNRPATNGAHGQFTYPQEATTQPAFPPTHGVPQSNSGSGTTPVQVAIYDLQRLLDSEEIRIKNALVPVATFEPSSGCSFLSFAPNGLSLLTVSRKGDQQFVWSLMRMQHPRSGITNEQHIGPHVRQIAKFTRLTEAITVDVVWNVPQGDRFALLTDKGTVHAHEIPASAFHWPPYKHGRRPKTFLKADEHSTAESGPAKGAIGAARDAVSGTGAWIRSAVRPKSVGNNSTSSTNLMMTPAITANVGGKAIKAGFTKSAKLVANSANTIYHAGENRLHVRVLMNGAVSPGSIRWMTGKYRGHLAITTAGTVNIYPVRTISTPRKGMPPEIRAKISKKPVEFTLQMIPDYQFAPAFQRLAETRTGNINVKANVNGSELSGFWLLQNSTPLEHNQVNPIPTIRKPENWHALVEAETNPPYQPFHTDRRVGLFVYSEPDPVSPKSSSHNVLDDSQAAIESRVEWQSDVLAPWLHDVHHVDPSSFIDHWPVNTPDPWVFGMEVPSTRVLISSSANSNENASWSDDEDAAENQIRVIEGEYGEQVVVTTVTRRGREDEEFFEDGCEVVDFADDRV